MNNIFKSLLVLFLVFGFQTARAEQYKVLYANSDKITIGTKKAVRGLVFDDGEKIVWTSDKQALKVLNLSSGHIVILPAVAFMKHHSETLKSHLIKVKHMSTKGIDTFKTEVDTICYILDTLRIDAGKDYGGKVTNKVVVGNGQNKKETTIRRATAGNESVFVIPRHAFGNLIEPTYIDVTETTEDGSWTYNIYRDLYVVLLPLKEGD